MSWLFLSKKILMGCSSTKKINVDVHSDYVDS